MPKYRTKPVEIEAVRLTEACQLGTQTGNAGDYLVLSNDSTVQSIITAQEFEAQYEAVPLRGRPKAPKAPKGKGKGAPQAAAAA